MLLAVVERLEIVGSTTGLAEGARSDLRLRRLLPKSVKLVSQDYLEFLPWRSCLLVGRIDVMQPCSNNVVACDCVCHEDGCQSTKARLLCRRKCGRHGLARWRCLTHRLYGVKSQRLRVAGRQGLDPLRCRAKIKPLAKYRFDPQFEYQSIICQLFEPLRFSADTDTTQTT